MARSNKFNIQWQIVRTKVRSEKDVGRKIKYVLDFLHKNKNIHNYDRVLNWLKMTGVAYKGDKREAFEIAVEKLQKESAAYKAAEDNDSDLSKIPTEDLKMVYKDLSKRKYGFQYKTTPKAHTDFVSALEKELSQR